MSKRGQGNVFWIIIAAIIGLIILLIVSAIFSDKITFFNRETQSCALRGGTCQVDSCGDGTQEIFETTCEEATPHCCVRLFDT